MSQNNNLPKISGALAGVLLSLAAAICFSSKGVLVKLMFRETEISPITVLALRMLIALPFYLVVLVQVGMKGKLKELSRRDLGIIFLLGILGYYLSSFFDMWGLKFIAVYVERIIIFIYPTMVFLINAWIFKVKIRPFQVFAIMLTYIGIFIAFYGNIGDVKNDNLFLGAALVFLSSLTYSFYLVFGNRMIARIGSITFTTLALLTSTFGVLLHYMIADGGTLLKMPQRIYFLGTIIAVVGTVLPTFMTAAAVKRIGPGNVAVLNTIGPVSTIFQAWYFLGEKVNSWEIFGSAFVIGGVLVISLKKES